MKQNVAFMDTQRIYLLLMMSVVANGVAATKYSCSSSPCPPDKPFCTSAGCVYKCPENSFINGTNCVLACDDGVVDGYNVCMEKCPEGKNFTLEKIVARNSMFMKIRICLSSCDGNLFQYKQTCVHNCPAEASFVIGKTCSSACSDALPLKYKRLENQSYVTCSSRCNYYNKPFVRNNTCVAQCNKGEVLVGIECSERCPNSSYFVFKSKCITQCPQNMYKFNTSCVDRCVSQNSSSSYIFGKSCLDQCPEESNFFKNTTRGYVCVANCGNYLLERQCVDQCPSDTYLVNRSCVQTCPSILPYMYVFTQPIHHWSSRSAPTIRECVSECPFDTFYNNASCTKECPAKVLNRTCVDECPRELPYSSYVIGSIPYYTTDTKIPRCVKECPAQITVQQNFTCLRTCPHFSYNNACVTACPNATLKVNKICYDECPSNLIRYRDECVFQCPAEANNVLNRTCVSECPKGMYRTTIEPYGNFIIVNSNQHECVHECPASKVLNGTECIHCPLNFVIFNQTCVKNCPMSMLRVDYNCIYTCPNSTVYYNNKCVPNCPKDTFKHNHTCFDQCPQLAPLEYDACDFKGTICWQNSDHKKLCVDKCPDSYSLNFTCVESCPSNLIQYDSRCLDICPDGCFWVYTFAGPNGTCVSMWAIYGPIIGSATSSAALFACCTKFLRFRPCRSFIAMLGSIRKTIVNARKRPEDYQLVPRDLGGEEEEV